MAARVDSAAQSFGNVIRDVVSNVGSLSGKGVDYLVIRGKRSENATVQKVYQFFQKYQAQIANFAYALGAFYNFATSPLIFTVGVGLGFIASATSLGFPSLEKREVCGLTANDGYAGQKAMAVLGIANQYLGTHFWEDAFFGGTAGLLVGNTLYHQFNEATLVKNLKNFSNNAKEFAAGLPLIARLLANTRAAGVQEIHITT